MLMDENPHQERALPSCPARRPTKVSKATKKEKKNWQAAVKFARTRQTSAGAMTAWEEHVRRQHQESSTPGSNAVAGKVSWEDIYFSERRMVEGASGPESLVPLRRVAGDGQELPIDAFQRMRISQS